MRRHVADLRNPWWQNLIPVGPPVALGQHSARHFGVSTASGQVYGVKATPSDAITRAVQFGRLASLLHVPGSCKAVRHPTIPNFPNVGGSDLLITEWVPGGVSFGYLTRTGEHKDL